MARFGFILVLISVIGLLAWSWGQSKLPTWKSQVREVLALAQEAGTDETRWRLVFEKAEDLPSIYPVSSVKQVVAEVEKIFKALEDFKSYDWEIESNQLPHRVVNKISSLIKNIDHSIQRIESKINDVPSFLLSKKEQLERDKGLQALRSIQSALSVLRRLEAVWEDFRDGERRLVILLQNENEPRSTGGFAGSMLVVDATTEALTWKFEDVYALDRRVPGKVQKPAPEFFHNLSQVISLRDANFWPDFPFTAGVYREFWGSIGEKVPDTIVGINLNTPREILKLIGPVHLDKWGITLTADNFDLGLQFLVEGKVSGRFAVKEPVLIFLQAVMQKTKTAGIPLENLQTWDYGTFLSGKNILAYSKNKTLQRLFVEWGIEGQVQQKSAADNFLHFDFVSIGANKSDKFVWTKLEHNSNVAADGRVRNTLKITRNHALQPGEMEQLMDLDHWPINVRNLLTEDLKWKLGAGENRLVLRVYVPREAKLVSQVSPSGVVTEVMAEDGDFKVFQIPMNVLPGEKLVTQIQYETQIQEGSQNWRPYFLQLSGTPGRAKTSLLTTISTDSRGKFSAETSNIGLPVELVDQDFRTVLEFE
jgi:hypothetical protein